MNPLKKLNSNLNISPLVINNRAKESPGTEQFGLHISKENFKFAAAHFLTFPDGSSENLHGHNYQVEAKIEGSTDKAGMIYDFHDIKPIIKRICQELDHSILLPGENSLIQIETDSGGKTGQESIFVSYMDKKYMFPAAEVVILPIDNTSVERFAYYICHRFHSELLKVFNTFHIRTLKIIVHESLGQSGSYKKNFNKTYE